MAKTSFCGVPSDLPLNPTVDQLAKEIERLQPQLWKQLYTKIIQPPNGYSSPKLPAIAIAVSMMEGAHQRKKNKNSLAAGSATNIQGTASLLMQYDFPTYYIGRELLRSLIHTKPPEELWQDIPLPFSAMTFMLPEGFIREPHTGNSVNFLSFGRLPYRTRGEVFAFGNPDIDRINIWYGVNNGIDLQSVVFPVNQKLLPSTDWIQKATDHYSQVTTELWDKNKASNEFLAYIAGLVANLILIKQARPELVSEKGSGHINTAKNGNKFYRPIWIGEKYKSQRETGVLAVEAAGHFTELRWRSGHWRMQHHGPGNKQTKVIWIESFLAHGGNLVREDEVIKELAKQ
jgi:hypothetical protein